MAYATKAPPRPAIEDVELDDNKKMAGTAKDAQEMERLGRQQQLNVCRDNARHWKSGS
jgi:hypothetical protein